MKDLKQILAVGSIAYDSLDTPKGNRERILGGSCTYFSVAASHYAKTSIIGVVGNDFDNKSWSLFKEYNIDTECVEIADGPTFSWGQANIIAIILNVTHYLLISVFLNILNQKLIQI